MYETQLSLLCDDPFSFSDLYDVPVFLALFLFSWFVCWSFAGDAEYAVQNICVYLLEYLFFYFMLAWSGFCDALAIR